MIFPEINNLHSFIFLLIILIVFWYFDDILYQLLAFFSLEFGDDVQKNQKNLNFDK